MKKQFGVLVFVVLAIIVLVAIPASASPAQSAAMTRLAPSAMYTQSITDSARMEFTTLDALPSNLSTTKNIMAGTLPFQAAGRSAVTMWGVVSFDGMYYVNGTNDSSNYWKLRLLTFSGTEIHYSYTYNHKTTCTANGWCKFGADDSGALSVYMSTDMGLYVRAEKVGNPGPLWVAAPDVYLDVAAYY